MGGVAAQDGVGRAVGAALEGDVEDLAAHAEAAEGDVGQPGGKVRVEGEDTAGGVDVDAEHGLQEGEDGAGGPGLRDVGAEVLDREAGGLAVHAGI